MPGIGNARIRKIESAWIPPPAGNRREKLPFVPSGRSPEGDTQVFAEAPENRDRPPERRIGGKRAEIMRNIEWPGKRTMQRRLRPGCAAGAGGDR